MKLLQNNTKDEEAEKKKYTREDFESDSEGLSDDDLNNSQVLQANKWRGFDLEQTKQGPYMNIKIESPLIIIPNLRNEEQWFEMDFGNVFVESNVLEE